MPAAAPRAAGPAPSVPLNELFPSLVQALREDDAAALDRLLDPNAEHAGVMRSLLRVHNVNGQTPLMVAAGEKRPTGVARLMALDPTLVQQTVAGDTVLHWAARGGSVEVLDLLLPVSDPTVRNRAGHNALMVAIEQERTPAAHRLLRVTTREQAAARDVQHRRTPLMLASMKGLDDLLEPLAALSDPLDVDQNGRNALLLAALHDWPRAVLRLLPLAPAAARHGTPVDGTAFRAMAFEVETHTDNGQRLIALDHLAVYEPDQALVTRTVQRYGGEHFPRWTVHREREALQATLDGNDGRKPNVKGRARL